MCIKEANTKISFSRECSDDFEERGEECFKYCSKKNDYEHE